MRVRISEVIAEEYRRRNECSFATSPGRTTITMEQAMILIADAHEHATTQDDTPLAVRRAYAALRDQIEETLAVEEGVTCR